MIILNNNHKINKNDNKDLNNILLRFVLLTKIKE